MKVVVKFLSIILLSCFNSILVASNKDSLSDNISLEKARFYQAKLELENMLEGKEKLDYERAIYLIETAYAGNLLEFEVFNTIVDWHCERVLDIASKHLNRFQVKSSLFETKEQQLDKYNRTVLNWAIYTYLTDSSYFIVDKDEMLLTLPFEYTNEDPLSTDNWSNSQVINLFQKRRGNCFALTSLFKIISERLKTEVNIATAQGHIFIRHKDYKGVLYNVELATRSFPGDGSIEVLTYTTNDAVLNGISLRSLDLKQSIALCLVYLAKGYEYKFNTKTDKFLLDCSEIVLKHDSLNLNAMLLKTEVLEKQLVNENGLNKLLKRNAEFKEYEELIFRLYDLGYREMPTEMKNIILSGTQKKDYPMFIKNQTPQPFKEYGIETRYATLSNGVFDEMHLEKKREKFSQTVFNTETRAIEKFEAKESTYNNYKFDPVVFAWQIDPMAHKYPNYSPYSAFENSPICIVDPGGDTTVYYTRAGKRFEMLNDGLPTAIVILDDDKVALFTEEYNSMQKAGAEKVSWRSYGKTFDVGAFRKFYNDNTVPGVDNKSENSPTGYNTPGYFNEARTYIYEKDEIIKPGTKVAKGSTGVVTEYPEEEPEMGKFVGDVHTHPNEGMPNGIRIFRYGPSKEDVDNSGPNDVVVGKKNIYIFGNVGITIDKNTLQPVKKDE